MSDIPTDSTIDSPSSGDPFAAAKASASKAAEDLRNAAAAKAAEIREAAQARAQQFRDAAGEKAADFREYADKAWSGARDQAKDFASDAEKFTREKPMQALLTAFGVGLLAGLLLRR
jgi:ElaB/YqjD/DUF883 family membrane-anchored ribosome-binding protein